MEKYIQDIRLKQWCELINAANSSGLPRKVWLNENGVSKDSFYYWLKKVRKYYAEQNNLIPTSVKAESTHLVEVPLVRPSANNGIVPAAVIKIGSVTVEISPHATAEFMENLGRMIHNAL